MNTEFYNIDKLVDLFKVSYEQAAHRFVTLTPDCLHFLKVNADGIIKKRFSSEHNPIDWPQLNVLCKQWGAMKVLYDGENSETYYQISEIIDKNDEKFHRFICSSKAIEKENGHTFSITLGAPLEGGQKFVRDIQSLDTIRASGVSCSNPEECLFKFCLGDKK